MGSADHHSFLVTDGEDDIDGEDEGKYVGREDGTNDEGFDDGVDDHDEVKGSQMGLEKSSTDPVGWTLK